MTATTPRQILGNAIVADGGSSAPWSRRVHRIIQQSRALLTAGYGMLDRLVVLGPGRALPMGLHQRLGIFRREHVWPTRPVAEQIAAIVRDALAYLREPMTVTVELVERIELDSLKFRDVIGLPPRASREPA